MRLAQTVMTGRNDSRGKLTGDQLRELRQWRQMTQGQLAALLGVTAGLVSQWEAGKRPIPERRLEGLQRILQGHDSDRLGWWFLDPDDLDQISVRGGGARDDFPSDQMEDGETLGEWVKQRQAAAVSILGDEAEPFARQGDILVIDPAWNAAPGDLVFVIADDRPVLARLEQQGGESFFVSLGATSILQANQVWRAARVLAQLRPEGGQLTVVWRSVE